MNTQKEPPPEGPEVRRITVQLDSALSGKKMQKIKVVSGRYLKQQLSGMQNFSLQLPLQIKNIKCKGKFIYFTFMDTEWNI